MDVFKEPIDHEKGAGYIYKITSPSGKIYVGQTIKIKARFSKYKRLDCKGQIKLYNSFAKYGYFNHSFEILEGPIKENVLNALNDFEVLYIAKFDCVNAGLNSFAGGLNRIPNAETRKRMSEAQKSRDKSTYKFGPLSEEHVAKLKVAQLGRKQSEETKNKRRAKALGHVGWNKGLKSTGGKISKSNILKVA